ncbi:phage major capsid protein [Klebsiella michiganensis]|uniref:phage major capsid protein n=1 Tax=Klebsiella michiganensis TaxID=1134687 RepID=UPI0009498053
MDVTSGKELAGPDIRNSCQRHLNDLQSCHARGLHWDVEAAQRSIDYFAKVLKLNGGDFEGEPFVLLPWQCFIVGSIFGWKNARGFRRFRMVYVESGKGSGKSPLSAGILGILPQATEFAPALTLSNATPIDRLRLAVLQAVLAEYPASGFVLNPIDWAGIELTKDNEGRYIIAQPVNGGVPRIWGLPVVETQAMVQNNFLTGAFNMAAQIFDRMDIEVLLSTENEDDFIKNMVTIRAEERLALAVYRPEAFVTGNVTASGG